MESWTTGVLKDAVLFKNGKASKERLDKGTFPLMGSNGQIGFANSSNAREGCLVIGRVGAYCGSIFHLNSDSWVTDNAILGTVYNEYDSRYVFYKLSRLGLREFAGGSAQPLLNQSILNRIKVTFPPLPEQKRIAEILGALDDKIELNLEINKTLEAMAMALYKEWFVDFGPFRDNGMVDSELGPIPKGWEVRRLIDIATLTMGQSPRSVFYNDTGSGLPFHQGVTNYGLRFPDNNTFSIEGNRLAESGDILFSVRAPVGRINVALKKMILGRGLAAIHLNNHDNPFLFYALKTIFKSDDLIGDGTVYKSVNKSDMENIRIIWPSDTKVAEFNKLVGELDELILSNHLEIKSLTKTRDTLLPKLISGDVRVKMPEELTAV